MSAKVEHPFAVEKSFRKALEVLVFRAKASSIAKEYYTVMSSLLDAVTSRQVHTNPNVLPKSQPLLDQLFTFNTGQPNQPTPSSIPQALDGGHFQQFANDNGHNDAYSPLCDVNRELDFGAFGWAQFADQVSDLIPLDKEALERFLNSI